MKQDVHLVRADYYSAEIQFQDQIDRIDRTDALGRQVVIEYSAKHRQLGLQPPPFHQSPEGQIKLYRPNDPSLDQLVPLKLGEKQRQFVDVKDLANGLWRVELSWQSGGQEFFKAQKIVVSNPSS